MEEEEQEDRISNLPDSIIHHILSYLPSTRQVIQTGILSTQWYKQWTHVPVLIFDFSQLSDKEKEKTISSFDSLPPLFMEDPNFSDKGDISSSDISKIIEDTLSLHNCSKINNFRLQMLSIVSFRKGSYVLPDFLFNNASLLKLKTVGCIFMPTGTVNWASLTALLVKSCALPDRVVLKHILSGSPLLKCLELSCVHFEFHKLVVSSKSLKRFVLDLPMFQYEANSLIELEISCPRLEELSLNCMFMHGGFYSRLDQVIQNVLSNSLLLESLELTECGSVYNLVIASKSLRRLVLSDLVNCLAIEISCSKLEELELSGCLNVRSAKLMNLQYSLCATIDFYQDNEELDVFAGLADDESPDIQQILVEVLLKQLKDVKQLKIGSWFIQVLSTIDVGGLFSTELNINCLILKYPTSDANYSGFASLLRNSNMLEKLVIDLSLYEYYDGDVGEDYWNSKGIAFDCLASQLKIVKIIGFPKRGNRKIINFVRFLLKNARVLETLVVILKDRGTTFLSEASEELLKLPRCSEKAIVELLC